jgi:site-specific DNA recombinase
MKAATYTRISQDREGLEVGVERQESLCRELAQQRGWDVEGVYSDNDISASSGKRRPSWERLLMGIETGTIEAVLAYSSSRMYRRPADLQRLIDLAKTRGIEIATVASGNIDLSTADGRMIAGLLAQIDQGEVERTGERVKAAHAERSLDGGWHGGGRRPYGYQIEGGKEKDGHSARITADKAEAKVLRQMVEAALSGQSLYRIAASVNARGLTTASGARWKPGHIKRMLLSPFHAGRLPSGVKGSWPELISENEQRTLKARLVNHVGQKREGRRYVLSGLIRCGSCGTPLVGSGGYYRCNAQSGGCAKVSAKVASVDPYVLVEVRDQINRLMLSAAVVEEPLESRNRDAVLTELGEIETRLDKLAEDYAAGVLDARQMKIAGDKMRSRRSELEGELRKQGEPRPFPLTDYDLDKLEAWTPDKILGVRDLIRDVAQSIELSNGRGFTPERVSITWRTDVSMVVVRGGA